MSYLFVAEPENSIFIGNLPFDITKEELQSIFEEPELLVDLPVRTRGEKTVPGGFAFVQFPQNIDFDELKKQYNKKDIRGREIYVRAVLNQEQREEKRVQKNAAREEGKNKRAQAKKNKEKSGSSISQEVETKDKVPLDQMVRSRDTLYIGNLPFDATSIQLAEFFGVDPPFVNLPVRKKFNKKEKTTSSVNKGFAFITFAGDTDIKAKLEEFKGKQFNERPLVVDIAANKPELAPSV